MDGIHTETTDDRVPEGTVPIPVEVEARGNGAGLSLAAYEGGAMAILEDDGGLVDIQTHEVPWVLRELADLHRRHAPQPEAETVEPVNVEPARWTITGTVSHLAQDDARDLELIARGSDRYQLRQAGGDVSLHLEGRELEALALVALRAVQEVRGLTAVARVVSQRFEAIGSGIEAAVEVAR